MAEMLKRWDETIQQWIPVSSVNRIEVSGGSGLEFINFFANYSMYLDAPQG